MKKILLTLGAVAAMTSSAWSLGFVPVNDNITEDTRWTRDNVYILTRLIFVEPGAKLTVEPGTIIRGLDNIQSGLSLEPGALIVAKDALLVANGTPDAPIIWTSIDDPNVPGGIATIPPTVDLPSRDDINPAPPVNGPTTRAAKTISYNGSGIDDYGPSSGRVVDPQIYGTDPADNTPQPLVYSPSVTGAAATSAFGIHGVWGGVIILGNCWVSQNTGGLSFPYAPGDLVCPTGVATGDSSFVGCDAIEGIDAPSLAGDGRSAFAIYGGADAGDNSGVLRFNSIRYGGFIIGAANEINSLTTGGVGPATVFEFIECTFNQDDGYEYFGGCQNTRFTFSGWVLDDSFDGDEGYAGENQFMLAIQANTALQPTIGSGGGGDAIEFDGVEGASKGAPATDLKIWNFTLFAPIGNIDVDGALSGGSFNGVLSLGATSSACTLDDGTFVGNNFIHDSASVNDGGAAFAPTALVAGAVPAGPGAEWLALDIVNFNYGVNDFRIPAGGGAGAPFADDGAGTVFPTNPNGVDATWAGAFRDHNWLAGWSHAESLGTIAASGPRPAITVAPSGADNMISWTATAGNGGRSVEYLVERTVNGKDWTIVFQGAKPAGAASETDAAAPAFATYRVIGL